VLVVFPLFSLPAWKPDVRTAGAGLHHDAVGLSGCLADGDAGPGVLHAPEGPFPQTEGDPFPASLLKWMDGYLLRFSLRHSTAVLAVVSVLVLTCISCILWMGGEFLPRFNEAPDHRRDGSAGSEYRGIDRIALRIERC